MRKLLAITAILGLSTSISQAGILAGWDTWSNGANANELETGFTATFSGGGGTNGGLGSNDGTFGTVTGADDTNLNTLLIRNNGSAVSAQFTLTNNTGQDYNITGLHFDFGARSSGPDSFTVTYLSGGLGPANTLIDTVTDLPNPSSTPTFADFDYTLSTSLSDIVLGDGESATFEIKVTNGNSSTSSALDNLAFQGAVVPEPASLALLGIGGVLIASRRR